MLQITDLKHLKIDELDFSDTSKEELIMTLKQVLTSLKNSDEMFDIMNNYCDEWHQMYLDVKPYKLTYEKGLKLPFGFKIVRKV